MNARGVLWSLAGLGLAVGLGFSHTSAGAVEEPPAWLASARLGQGHSPVVAANARGDAVVAWTSLERNGVVRASFRPAGGGWQRMIEWPAGWATAPRAAIDDAGNAIVAWTGYAESSSVVQASLRRVGSGWTSPRALSPEPGWAWGERVRVGMDGEGNALVAWQQISPDSGVRTRYKPAESTAWEPAFTMPWAYSGFELSVARGGRALLAWDASYDSGYGIVAAVGTDGRWGPPHEIGNEERGVLSSAVGDSSAVVAWDHSVHGNSIVRAAVQRPDSTWEAPVDLSFDDGQAYLPATVIDGRGDLLAVWDANVDLEGSVRSSGAGGWDRPIVVSPSRGAPRLAANAGGEAVALWSTYGSAASSVQAARRHAASSSWEATTDVTTAGRFGTTGVAIDGAGDAIAVWQRYDGAWWIEIAASDVAAPVLTKLVVPRSARARKPVRLSATARDTWSRVSPPAWTFGDGMRARGSTVTHRYRSPGRYRVTVTAMDALGHTTTGTRTIRVRR